MPEPGYLVVVSRGMFPAPPPLFYVFVGVVILFTGYDAIQSLRDLVSGVALVQEDLLNRTHPGRGPRTYYGHFERLGKLRMIPKVHFRNSPGQRYRVV